MKEEFRYLTPTEVKNEIRSELDFIKSETNTTSVNKSNFVNQIKKDLGDEIKTKGRQVTIIKKTKTQKIVEWFTKIFTKF